jgi:hypothetical protein
VWRRFRKWAFVAAAIGLAAIWWLSGYYIFAWRGDGKWVNANAGAVTLFRNVALTPKELGQLPSPASYYSPPRDGFSIEARSWPWRPSWWFSFDYVRHYGRQWITVPLWAPFALCLTVTAITWRADRRGALRALGGLCASCGYDRRGLAADATCPECGTAPSLATADR